MASNRMKKYIFWEYARGSWQYDVIVGVIVAFLFLTPRDWFRDQPRIPQASDISSLPSERGTHHLDLTEDVARARRVRELAVDASKAFIPQCGLAPGFVSIVAFDMAQRVEGLDSVKLRVGALPQYLSNALSYSLTWNTDGVINEYCEPCDAIVNGVRRETQPLEEREQFSLDGVIYEAFNTSGGLGTLCDTLIGHAIEGKL